MNFTSIGEMFDDTDVIRCLKLLTFLPVSEINELAKLKDQGINKAKKILAFEVTKLVHNEAEAKKAQQAAEALFGEGSDLSNMPTVKIHKSKLSAGINILDLLAETVVLPSKAEGRRLIQQNGLSINDVKVASIELTLTEKDFTEGYIIVKRGKKDVQQNRTCLKKNIIKQITAQKGGYLLSALFLQN